jgi:hypothetical protein
MRVSALANGMNVQGPSKATGTQATSSTSFQARLSPVTGGHASAVEGGPTGAEILQQASQDMRAMLRLQVQLSRSESSLISNIFKARHDTAKNSIQNIR